MEAALPPKPTDAELAILAVLWRRGAATVREVADDLSEQQEKPVGYTTALKLLQIMTEKGLVNRAEDGRRHVYRPAERRETTQRRLLGDLLERAYGGAASKLVMQALSSRAATPAELAEIRAVLERLEAEAGDA
jgi:BlaI family transcriptional regulator, penicillinase repressor